MEHYIFKEIRLQHYAGLQQEYKFATLAFCNYLLDNPTSVCIRTEQMQQQLNRARNLCTVVVHNGCPNETRYVSLSEGYNYYSEVVLEPAS